VQGHRLAHEGPVVDPAPHQPPIVRADETLAGDVEAGYLGAVPEHDRLELGTPLLVRIEHHLEHQRHGRVRVHRLGQDVEGPGLVHVVVAAVQDEVPGRAVEAHVQLGAAGVVGAGVELQQRESVALRIGADASGDVAVHLVGIHHHDDLALVEIDGLQCAD
jgi:hypothetical protein